MACLEQLPPYHLLNSENQLEDWLHCCDSADLILAMPVRAGYRNFRNIGTDLFRERMGQRLHLVPNLYSDAFFPFFGYAKNQDGLTLTHAEYPANPHGDYHDFLAMAIADSPIPWGRVQRTRLLLAANYQGGLIAGLARKSLDELRRRVVEMNSSLKGETLLMEYLCGYAFNHPPARLLNVLYASIWSKILKLNSLDFQPIEGEPFADGTILPVPDFVLRSLFRVDPALEIASFPRPIDPFCSYDEMLRKAMRFYGGAEEIVRMNRHHPKFKAAKCFLRFARRSP